MTCITKGLLSMRSTRIRRKKSITYRTKNDVRNAKVGWQILLKENAQHLKKRCFVCQTV